MRGLEKRSIYTHEMGLPIGDSIVHGMAKPPYPSFSKGAPSEFCFEMIPPFSKGRVGGICAINDYKT